LKISQYKKSTYVAFFDVRYSNILISRVVKFNENILNIKGGIDYKIDMILVYILPSKDINLYVNVLKDFQT
jgi:hypothetical protein